MKSNITTRIYGYVNYNDMWDMRSSIHYCLYPNQYMAGSIKEWFL